MKWLTNLQSNVLHCVNITLSLMLKLSKHYWKFQSEELHARGKVWGDMGFKQEQTKKRVGCTLSAEHGHDCLAAHMYKINIQQSENCTFSQEPNSKINRTLLLNCRRLDPEDPMWYWVSQHLANCTEMQQN